MNSLQDLLDTGKGMIFYELVQLCRDRNHKLFGNTGEQLHNWGLIERHGDSFQVHDATRDIVLSASEGDGLEMTLGNPIAGKRVAERGWNVIGGKT